ncbi:MAG: hypothetical protein N2439_00780 [Anaerolineae bacterium]|nr:hypothetical protein [Anaerolineae bacterium]
MWRGLLRLCTGRLTLDDLWLILPPVMAFLFLVNRQIHPADFWWHVRTGQIIATTGQIPTTDLFTFTRAGETWINQAWLMQLFFYLVLRVGGLPLVLFAHATVITAGYLLVELACLRAAAGRPRAAALATIAALAIGIVHWQVRPQSASYLGFGATVYILTRMRAGPTRLMWALPVVFALWVNAHGGFVFGLGLVLIYAAARVVSEWLAGRRAGREMLHLLPAAALSIAALALNPGGPLQAVRYVFSFLASNPTIQKNLEFQPLSIREADGLIFFAVLLVTLALLWRRPHAARPEQIAILVIFGLAALYVRRIVPWYGMALAPTLALAASALAAPSPTSPAPPAPSPSQSGDEGGGKTGGGFGRRLRRPKPPFAGLPGREGVGGEARGEVPILNYLVLAIMVFFLIVMSPWARPYVPAPFSRAYVVEDFTSEEAARRICALGPTTRAYMNIHFASYLTWACPTVPIFMDTRFELYPPAMWLDYIRIMNGLYDWEARLAKYGIDTLFIQKESESELVAAAQASGRWETLYEDTYAILMRRRAGP